MGPVMEIKEIGGVAVVVVGGAVFGISQMGLNDVLSEDLRPLAEVSMQERPAYMSGIVNEFSEVFDTYFIETESYTYVGQSKFTTAPSSGTFMEVVRQNEAVPKKEMKKLTNFMKESNFCEQDEMTMFTDKGWTYRFRMVDGKGNQVYAVICRPAKMHQAAPKLRGMS